MKQWKERVNIFKHRLLRSVKKKFEQKTKRFKWNLLSRLTPTVNVYLFSIYTEQKILAILWDMLVFQQKNLNKIMAARHRCRTIWPNIVARRRWRWQNKEKATGPRRWRVVRGSGKGKKSRPQTLKRLMGAIFTANVFFRIRTYANVYGTIGLGGRTWGVATFCALLVGSMAFFKNLADVRCRRGGVHVAFCTRHLKAVRIADDVGILKTHRKARLAMVAWKGVI